MNRSPITYQDLARKEFPEPLYLITPWLKERNLLMIHSWRGVGKTFFAMAIAQAIASGSQFLKWATNPAPVFYFDCEMGERSLKSRFQLLDRSAQYSVPGTAVEFFTYEHMGGVTWNLADTRNQAALNSYISRAKLIIIDNLSAAVRPIGREDFRAAYFRFRDWLLALVSSGRTVFLIHHSGKEGKQRGISDIEDPLDVVIHLKHPEDWHPTQGTKFDLHFEKGRDLEPAAQESLSIEMNIVDDRVTWLHAPWQEVEKKRRKAKEENFINWNGGDDEELF